MYVHSFFLPYVGIGNELHQQQESERCSESINDVTHTSRTPPVLQHTPPLPAVYRDMGTPATRGDESVPLRLTRIFMQASRSDNSQLICP
jgi:hypothetical protein